MSPARVLDASPKLLQHARSLFLVELLGFWRVLACWPDTLSCKAHSPAAVLFFLGAPLPLDVATFRCSTQSSSSSSMMSYSGYSDRSWLIAPMRGG